MLLATNHYQRHHQQHHQCHQRQLERPQQGASGCLRRPKRVRAAPEASGERQRPLLRWLASGGRQQLLAAASRQQQQQQPSSSSPLPQPDANGLRMDKNKKLFPQRLWELIHDEKYNFCLRWSQDGQRVYLNRNEFEAHYLKTPNNQFHTQKAISFVRQMNMYGFRKVDDCYYENDNFKRDCPHLLKSMVRRHSSKCFLATSQAAGHHQHHHHHHHHDVSGRAAAAATATDQHWQTAPPFHRGAAETTTRGALSSSSSPPPPPLPSIAAPPPPLPAPLACQPVNQQLQQQVATVLPSAAAAAAAATCFGGSLGNLGAALAAISPNSQQLGAAFKIPPHQASSLYHRLAALNFGGSQSNGQSQQQRTAAANLVPSNQQQAIQQQQQPRLPISHPLYPQHHHHHQQHQQQNFDRANRLLLDQSQEHHNDAFDIPMGIQESLTIRQAIQHDLFRSFLQISKHPSAPPLEQQQQQQQHQHQLSSNLLLESLANLTRANLVATRTATESNGVQVPPISTNGFTLNAQPPALGPVLDRGADDVYESIQVDEEEEDDDDDISIDYEDEVISGGGGTQYSSSSSSNNGPSTRYQQDNFAQDTVLNLAKPSNTRSNTSGQNISPPQ